MAVRCFSSAQMSPNAVNLVTLMAEETDLVGKYAVMESASLGFDLVMIGYGMSLHTLGLRGRKNMGCYFLERLLL